MDKETDLPVSSESRLHRILHMHLWGKRHPAAQDWQTPPWRTVLLFASLVFLCQVTDAICTTQAISTGDAIELNPIMAWLLTKDYGTFIITKTVLALLTAGLCAYGSRHYRWAWIATRIILLLLLLLVVFHLTAYMLYSYLYG